MLEKSSNFHHISKDTKRGHIPILKDTSLWPLEWKTTYYKSYSRLKKIELSKTKLIADLGTTVQERSSQRDFTRKSIGLDTLSTLLQYSCGVTTTLTDGRKKRANPSGGARYPIELYPIILQNSEELPVGLYHYNIADHALDILAEKQLVERAVENLFLYDWAKNASAALIMTAVLTRTQQKYGERGYRYVLLEAGHIGQNMYLISEALGLKCCGLGGTNDIALEKLIDIDGISESVVYAVVVGA